MCKEDIFNQEKTAKQKTSIQDYTYTTITAWRTRLSSHCI